MKHAQGRRNFTSGYTYVFAALATAAGVSLFPSAHASGFGPRPAVESRFDFGVSLLEIPARTGGIASGSAMAKYSSLFARARWLVPYEMEYVTFSGGFHFGLHPSLANLALTAPIGPGGRYFSEYGLVLRSEYDWGPVLAASGVTANASRADFAELAISTWEPSLSMELRSTLAAPDLLPSGMGPELRAEGRFSPFLGSYRVQESDAVSPENGPKNIRFLNEGDGLTTWSIELAAGVRYLSRAEPAEVPGTGRHLGRDAVLLVGASHTRRTFKNLRIASVGDGESQSDATSSITSLYLSVQGLLP